MEATKGFGPVINAQTRVLILGSHPGVVSLRKQQYYGNPGNAFWRTVFSALGISDPVNYTERLEALLAHGIGLWDVYDTVEREGSQDVNIKNETLNDFEHVLGQTAIHLIIANGQTAYRETQKHAIFQDYEVICGLSTSGLNNGREQERMKQWHEAIQYGLKKVSKKRTQFCE
ncbi:MULTISPECIES: DNA-deoxyinosine glycosylase [unclassified Jeotgalibaca]|uniref:DNA-deoxyinosine glycosylase n=1 Tax=unclassified Jeotgalibaca TaxID=2621505 RepID=UPI003FD5B0D1